MIAAVVVCAVLSVLLLGGSTIAARNRMPVMSDLLSVAAIACSVLIMLAPLVAER